MGEYNLYYRYPNGTIDTAPGSVRARNLEEAEAEGREILRFAGGIDKELVPGWEDLPNIMTDPAIEILNTLNGLPVFDHAEPTADTVKSQRKGQCRHNVTAKYCRVC